jgi:hypothetical protein
MATLVLSTVGTMLGGPVGGMLGSIVGQAIDQQLMGGGPRKGPRLGDLAVQTSSYGTPIPRIYGTMRVAGTVVWATDLKETSELQGDGKSGPETVAYAYSASFAVALSSRRAAEVRRIWADGKLIRGAAGDLKVGGTFRFLDGGEGQPVDPLVASIEGIGQAPAYRGTALALFEDLALAEFGNRIPNLTFELVADEGDAALGAVLGDMSGGAIDCGDARIVGGYAAHGANIAAAAEPLVETYGLALADEGDAFRTPADSAVVALGDQDLGASADGQPGAPVERRRAPASSVPSALALAYHEASRDYQSASARASWPAGHRAERALAFPGVLEAADAKGLADDLLVRAWDNRERVSIALPPTHLGLAPGARVTLAAAHGTWRVERARVERMVVTAELGRDPRRAGPSAADPGRPVSDPDIVALPSRLVLLDLADTGQPSGSAPTLQLAATSPSGGYRPVPLEVEIGGAIRAMASASAEAVGGTAAGALGAAPAALIDERNSIEVTLANADHWLTSCDDAMLAAGANLAAIGDEIVQFGLAEPIAAGRFRLSRLLRGRRGSEWAIGGHAAGEQFVMLNASSLMPVGLSAAQIGSVATVTAYGPANAADPPSVARAALGEAARPLAPCALSAAVEAGGGLEVGWIHRSRAAWAFLDEVAGQRDPDVSGYRVTISGSAGTIERDTTAETLTLSAAEAGSLGPGPVAIAVRQVGSIGLSRPASLIIQTS